MTTRSLRTTDRKRECDLAGDANSGKRPYARALQSATWGRTGRIADALGLSQRTVETWSNPADPQRGPNQTLAILIRESIAAGAAPEDALSPLVDLAEEFGFDLAPRVRVVSPSDLLAQADALAADALVQSGEAVSAYLSSLRDGHLTQREREGNRKELREAVRALLACLDHNERAGNPA